MEYVCLFLSQTFIKSQVVRNDLYDIFYDEEFAEMEEDCKAVKETPTGAHVV